MKTRQPWHVLVAAALALAASAGAVDAQVAIDQLFASHYSFVDLGAVPGLPANAAGLTFVPGDPNTILIGGAANSLVSDVFSIHVTRDASNHVTGFDGM